MTKAKFGIAAKVYKERKERGTLLAPNSYQLLLTAYRLLTPLTFHLNNARPFHLPPRSRPADPRQRCIVGQFIQRARLP